MITSERNYKDLTVIREHMIQVGADGSEEVDTVRVERRLPTHIEIIMPSEPLFAEAVGATAVAEHLAGIGAKGGNLPGDLTFSWYAVDHTGQPWVVSFQLNWPQFRSPTAAGWLLSIAKRAFAMAPVG